MALRQRRRIVFDMWGERTLTLPDFHDDFHGSALAHASLPVLQALHCTVGGCCRGGDEEREEGVKDRKREDVVEGEEKNGGRKRRRREDDTLVNEHVHNAQN